MKKKDEIKKMLAILDREYPQPKTSLNFKNPLELLVATILSAQCTDERVNQVTAELFQNYRRAEDYAQAPLTALEEDVRPTGFFRNKAKSIKGLGRALVEGHQGRAPETLEELVKLPGVGRKTANVVLGAAFGQPAVVVDTHVGRISRRLGLTAHEDPVKVEFDLMDQLPQDKWTNFGFQMIYHGRKICTSRKPKCEICPLSDLCDFARSK